MTLGLLAAPAATFPIMVLWLVIGLAAMALLMVGAVGLGKAAARGDRMNEQQAREAAWRRRERQRERRPTCRRGSKARR